MLPILERWIGDRSGIKTSEVDLNHVTSVTPSNTTVLLSLILMKMITCHQRVLSMGHIL